MNAIFISTSSLSKTTAPSDGKSSIAHAHISDSLKLLGFRPNRKKSHHPFRKHRNCIASNGVFVNVQHLIVKLFVHYTLSTCLKLPQRFSCETWLNNTFICLGHGQLTFDWDFTFYTLSMHAIKQLYDAFLCISPLDKMHTVLSSMFSKPVTLFN